MKQLLLRWLLHGRSISCVADITIGGADTFVRIQRDVLVWINSSGEPRVTVALTLGEALRALLAETLKENSTDGTDT